MQQAQKYLSDGRVIEVSWNGTHAVMASEEHLEYIRSAEPATGRHYSHKRETPVNPRGVWTFKKVVTA